MTANTIRSFAVGILVSAIVCGAVYFFGPNETVSKATTGKSAETPTVEEMKDRLKDEGYVVLTTEEYDSDVKNSGKKTENTEKTADKSKTDESGSEQPAEKETVTKTVINVVSGMTGIDVRNNLVDAKIITDGQAFTEAVERSGRVQDLRPGTYEVHSGMSLNELITAIYGSK